MPVNQAFGISEEDIATVLRTNAACLANPAVVDVDDLAAKLLDAFDPADHDRVAMAALDADISGDDDEDLQAQTNEAYVEIRAILVEQGVLTH